MCVQHMGDDKRANREPRYGRLSGFWGNLPGAGVNVGRDGRGRVNHVFDRALYRLSCCLAAEAEEPRTRGPGRGHRLP